MPTKVQKLLTKKLLYNEYIIVNKSTRTIGKEIGCSREPIRLALKKFGFKIGSTKSKLTGTKIPEARRLKIIANRPNRGKFRELSTSWKGNKAGYGARHTDIRRILLKPKSCSDCGKKTNKLDLANISQKYKRNIKDWEWLCRKCHMIKDGRLKKLKLCSFKYSQKDKNKILKLKKQGYKLIQIAKLYNTCYQNIQRILKINYPK